MIEDFEVEKIKLFIPKSVVTNLRRKNNGIKNVMLKTSNGMTDKNPRRHYEVEMEVKIPVRAVEYTPSELTSLLSELMSCGDNEDPEEIEDRIFKLVTRETKDARDIN